MDTGERGEKLDQLKKQVDAELNLFGFDEAPLNALDKAEDYKERLQVARVIMTPECHHRKGTCDCTFPMWFVKSKQRAMNRLIRFWKQYDIAEIADGSRHGPSESRGEGNNK